MDAFNPSGIKGRVHGNITQHYGSFVGRDFKAWAQMALFILGPYLDKDEQSVWLSLSQVYTQTLCTKNKCLQLCMCNVYVVLGEIHSDTSQIHTYHTTAIGTRTESNDYNTHVHNNGN